MPENMNDIYSQVGELRGRLVTTEAHVNSMLSHFEKRFDKVDDRLTKQAEVSAQRHEKIEGALSSIKEDVSNKVDERLRLQDEASTVRHTAVVAVLTELKDDFAASKVEASRDKGFILGAFVGSKQTIAAAFAGLVALCGFIGWLIGK